MILVNGVPSASIAVIDRGLMYGDGVFRTLNVKRGRVQFLQGHLTKLNDDCAAAMLPPLNLALILEDIELALHEVDRAALKLVITRGSGSRGYRFTSPQSPTRIVMRTPPPSYPAANSSDGVSVVLCKTRWATPAPLPGVKSLNRLENIIARAEWSDTEIAEGLMCTAAGNIISGTMSNFFYVRDGVLGTAELAECGVAGLQRARILDHAIGCAMPLTLKALHCDELDQVDELFVCNSLFEIWPIVSCGGLRWPVGPLTQRLHSELFRDHDGF